MDPEQDLRHQMAQLSARVAALEAAVRGQPLADIPAASAALPVLPAGALPEASRPGLSLESRIGAQVLNRIGILVVLIGAAWFLKLAFDRNWIGPPVRILIGLGCAAGLAAWSEKFRSRGFAAFSYGLKALGTGIAYLSLWAAFSVFHLAPAGLVFLAMAAITVANAVLARVQNSELLALYALAGGMATPELLSTGRSNELFLFSYLVLLNAGILLLLATHPWKRLAWGALLGTVLYYFGWTMSDAYPANVPLTALFLAVFFAAFAAAPWLIVRSHELLPRAPGLFPVPFCIANAAATFCALMVLFTHPDSGRAWATFALAGASLLLAVFLRASPSLSRTYLGLGIFFVTVAVALQFKRDAATPLWFAESLVLVAVAQRFPGTSVEVDGVGQAHAPWLSAAMRVYATMVLTLAGFSLLLRWIPGDWLGGANEPARSLIVNVDFGNSLMGAAVFAGVLGLSLAALRAYPAKSRFFGSWRWLAGFSAVGFSVTVLLAVSLEIHHAWFCGAGFFHDDCRGYVHQQQRAMIAGFSYSAWCMGYGAAVMAVGFFRQSGFLRWQALLLLALSAARIFMEGFSYPGQGYRVLSFLSLGGLLLAVSFAYQKDWLRLRG